MDIIEIFNAVQDKVREEQNGSLTISSFNIKSKSAEIKLLDYLSGDVEGIKPPEPYTTQKLRDWLSYFITPVKGVTENGQFPKPEDFYAEENAAIIGSYKDEECGDEVIRAGCDTPIEILDGAVYDYRCQTYIKSLQPSIQKPIAKLVGKNFEFNPQDLGSIKINYKRYPVFGEIKVKVDPVYMDEVPDAATSIDYEWPLFARNLLIFFITLQYSTSTRESALTQQLAVEGKSARG